MPAIYCGITIRCFTHAMVPSPYMRECFLKNTSPACNFNASFLENFMYNKDIHCNLGGPARILAPERHGGLSTATACSKLDIDAQRRAMKSCRVWIISKATWMADVKTRKKSTFRWCDHICSLLGSTMTNDLQNTSPNCVQAANWAKRNINYI